VISSVRKEIKDGQTGLFIIVLCAFGFAMIENIMYFCKYNEIILMRANPAHAVFSAIWGRALGRWFNKEILFKEFLKYLFYGMLLHAAWNYFASFYDFVFIILFIITSFYGLLFIKRELGKYSNYFDFILLAKFMVVFYKPLYKIWV